MIAPDIFRRPDVLSHHIVRRQQTQTKQMLQRVATGQHDGPPRKRRCLEAKKKCDHMKTLG